MLTPSATVDDAAPGLTAPVRSAPAQSASAQSVPARWEFADAPARTVDVDGAAISYRVWEEAGPDAPTLLFLHGFRAHARWWDHIVPFFQDRYRIATMDFSGLGDSGRRETYTLKTFAREVLAVIAEAGLGPVTIIAHSFGGSPAAYAGVIAPDAISHIVLIDSRMLLAGVPEPDPSELRHFASGRRVYPDLDELRRRYRLVPTAGEVDPEILGHVAFHSARPEGDGWTWKFDETFDPQLIGGVDRAVPAPPEIPIDYIYGDVSSVASPALVDRIVSLLPSCGSPIAIPRSDHHVLLEQPLALVATLRALLSRGPGPVAPDRRHGAAP